ncbi:DUF2637 domain-containing protein [Streptomyces sp. NBC_00433]
MLDPDWVAPRPVQLPEPFPEAQPDDTGTQWDIDAEFEYLFQSPVPAAAPPPQAARPAMPRVNHRRRRPRVVRVRRSAVLGMAIAGVTAAVTGTVSVLGAMVAYAPLRQLATPTTEGLASSWPLLVYGPWLVGSLSILNAAANRRSERAGWAAMILFSVIATALCVVHAPRTVTASAVAGLPPFSALASFLLLSRQITLLRPRRTKLPHQRKH